MVAMPYILVNIVGDLLSLVWFCVAGAALLSKYPIAGRYLPARIRKSRILVFAGHLLVLAALTVGGLSLTARERLLFELFGYVDFALTLVLAYQFLSGRHFRNMSRWPRRLLIATLAFVLTSAAFVVVANALVALFAIR